MIKPETVKVSHAALEEFLRGQANVLWNVVGGISFAIPVGSPCTVEDIMTRIREVSAGEEAVYVFSDLGEDGAYGAATRADWSNLPMASVKDLHAYVVTTVDGADFLYFACSFEEASSSQYNTLLPYREP